MIAAAPNALSGIGRLFALSGSGTSYAFVQFVAPASGGISAYAQPIGIDRMGTALVAGGSSNGIATDWTFNRTGANWFSGFSVAPPATNISMGGVAIDAGTVVVGGFYAAYVYSTSGGGPQTLTPSDFTPGSTSGYFGAPSAISGDSLLIGGEPEDGAGNFGHFGYVFVRSGSTWVEQAKLIPSDLVTNGAPQFRFSVSLDGSTAVLATSFGAYVFVRNGSSWTQTQKISVPSAAQNFGASVDLSGSAMVIGGPSSTGTAGAAYVYGRSNGSWLLGPILTSNSNGDGFGASVAVDRGTVAVGAPSSAADGALYLFSCQPDR